MPSLTQAEKDSFGLCILKKTGSNISQEVGGYLWTVDWGIVVPGPILTGQYNDESWSGAKNESSFHILDPLLPGAACHLRETGWGKMTLFGYSRSLPDFKEKAWCLIWQLLQPFGLGRCVKLGTSVSGYLLIRNVHLESLVWERETEFVLDVCTKFVSLHSDDVEGQE